MGAVCILCLYSTKFRTLAKGVLSKGRRKGLERESLGLQVNNKHPGLERESLGLQVNNKLPGPWDAGSGVHPCELGASRR